MGTTLAEKVWADHLVRKGSDGAPDLLYIDLMLMHEVTSPQAFEGLRLAGRKPRHVDQLIATEDTTRRPVDIDRPNPDETSALQLSTLEKNCKVSACVCARSATLTRGVVHAFAPGAGSDPAGHDHRVRRLAHLHPRQRSVLWPSASAPPKWSTSWPRRP